MRFKKIDIPQHNDNCQGSLNNGVNNNHNAATTNLPQSKQETISDPVKGKLPSNGTADATHLHTQISGGFEEILQRLGCFGPFQALTLVSYLLLEIVAAFVVFIPIFDALVSDSSARTLRTCSEGYNASNQIANNASGPMFTTHPTTEAVMSLPLSATIQETITLANYSENFDSQPREQTFLDKLSDDILPYFTSHESVIHEWDLTCDKAWIPDLFTSCMMAGMMVGNLAASQLADWYGRRKAYIIAVFLTFVATLISVLSPSPYVYAVARFLSGIGFCGIMNVSSMGVMEFMTPKWRSFANCLGPTGEGVMLLSLIAYYVHSWRLLYLATLIPYVFIIPIYMVLPESPRWLVRNNRLTEAHDVLLYMAKVNRKPALSMEVVEALRKHEEAESESLLGKRMGYSEFFKNRSLLVTSLYLFAIWFSWNTSYYGISYNIRNVPGNKYLYVALIGLANVIGQRASMPVSEWVGRRKAVLYAITTCAVSIVGLAICFLTMEAVTPVMIVIACFVGLLGMACTRAAARLLSGESFPTAVRTMGLGLGSLGSNIAGLVTPQVASLGSKWPALPFFVFASVSVLGSLVVFMMKETRGSPLSDEVEVEPKKEKEAKNKV